MVARFVEVSLPLPLMVRLVGGTSCVWMDVGRLLRTPAGLQVDWSPQGQAMAPAWQASAAPADAPPWTREFFEFGVRTELGPQVVARCPVTPALERAIREQVARQRQAKPCGGGPRLAAPRWWA
jgi:hypothetical protein